MGKFIINEACGLCEAARRCLVWSTAINGGGTPERPPWCLWGGHGGSKRGLSNSAFEERRAALFAQRNNTSNASSDAKGGAGLTGAGSLEDRPEPKTSASQIHRVHMPDVEDAE